MTVITDEFAVLFVGLDPGNITGIAAIVMSDIVASEPLLTQVPQSRAVDELSRILQPYAHIQGTCVAIERFLITERTIRATRTRTPQHVGALEDECRRQNVPVHLQTASDAKNFCTNRKLRQLGWYHASQGHAMDAARHLLLLVARTRPHYFERLIG